MLEKQIFITKALFNYPLPLLKRAIFFAKILKKESEENFILSFLKFQEDLYLPSGSEVVISEVMLHLLIYAKDEFLLSESELLDLKNIYLHPFKNLK